MRYLVALLLVFGGVFAGDASAGTVYVATREIAWTQCRADAAGRPPNGSHLVKCTTNYSNNASAGHARVADCLTNSPYTETASCWASPYNEYDYPTANNGCPTGTTWNDAYKKCLSPAMCLARNTDLGSAAGEPRPSFTTSRCVAGCEFGMATSGSGYTSVSFGGQTIYRGVMEYTGGLCSANPPALPDGNEADQKEIPPQECMSVSGQNVCVKPNGDQCYSGPIGRPLQFCWRPGETGNKSSGDVDQVRQAGSSTPPPSTPPPGDSFQATDPPMNTVTNLGGSGVVVNTTIQNYTTASGTNAGTVNSGELPDGTGGAGSVDDGNPSSDQGDGPNCDDCDTDDGSAEHEGDSVWGEGETPGFTADESGFGFGTSCPAPPTIRGQQMDFLQFCTIMGYIGLLVFAAAHVHAAYIFMGD